MVIRSETVIDQRQQALARRPVGAVWQPCQLHDRLGHIMQRYGHLDHAALRHACVPDPQRHMGGAVPLAHLVETVVGAKVEPIV